MLVFLQDLSSLFIKYVNFCLQKKLKNPLNIIIPHSLQPGKACKSIEDESTRINFMLNPGVNGKERIHSRENINAKDSPTRSYMKICLFRC